MNKKAQVLYYAFILALSFAFIYFVILQLQQHTGPQRYTGALAVDVLQAAEKAELILLYYEQAARLSAYRAVLDLARSGGLMTPECGSYLDAPIISKKCIPELVNNFEQFFNKRMKELIELYPKGAQQLSEQGFSITPNLAFAPFKVYTEATTLVAASAQPMSISFPSQQPLGTYSIRPDVRVLSAYDFKLLADAQETMKGLLQIKDLTERREKHADIPSACSSTPENLFWDVVEHIEQCIAIQDDGEINCRCELTKLDMSAIGKHSILLEYNGKLTGKLLDNDRVLKTHHFEQSVQPAVLGTEQSAFKETNLLSITYSNGLVIERVVSPHTVLYRKKNSDQNFLAFVADTQTVPPQKCPVPPLKKFRACIRAGEVPQYNAMTKKIEPVPVHFQVAVDVS